MLLIETFPPGTPGMMGHNSGRYTLVQENMSWKPESKAPMFHSGLLLRANGVPDRGLEIRDKQGLLRLIFGFSTISKSWLWGSRI